MKIFDISPTISPAIAVWPGDVAFARRVALDFKQGDNLVLSSIQSTVHVGAHADAPNHYHPDGADIASRSLNYYIGPCQVVHLRLSAGARIYPADLAEREIRMPRILFGTDSFPDPDHWNSDFNSLSPELVDYLADRGVMLVGIDTPSVDPEQSKALEAHQAIFRRDLAVLEGLVLTDVPEGCYFLIAPPLKLRDADASPVRALLLPGADTPFGMATGPGREADWPE